MSSSGKEKCNILILSADFGAGHLQVSNALRRTMRMYRPAWNVEILNFFDYVDPVFKQLIKFSYFQVIKHFAHGYEWFYKATKEVDSDSRWQQFLNKMGQDKLLDNIQAISPHAIVCTFPTPAGVVSQLKGDGAIDMPLITVITDVAIHSQWIHPHTDVYMVAADALSTHLLERGIPKESIHVTGIPLRSQFEHCAVETHIWEQYGLDPERFTLMMMGGGDGLLPGIEDVCEKLNELTFPMQVVVIAGNNKSLIKKMEGISETCKFPLYVLGYVDNIAPLMKISDLLLTKAGGVTVFEALAADLPMILYKPLPGHEMSNAEFLIKHGVATMADDEETAVLHIKTLGENASILTKMGKCINTIAKPYATRDAVNIIMMAAEKYKNKVRHLYA